MTTMAYITKETFLEAQECPTRAWLNRRVAGGAPTPADLLRMEEGMEVHRRARALLPGAVRVREAEMTAAAEHTRQLMADPAVVTILEAAFLVDGFATRADIITREGAGWRMIEIKSGVNDKNDEYDADIAYTTMVMTRAGTRPVGVTLRLLSRDYRLGMDDAALFADYDKTDTALAAAEEYAAVWDETIDVFLGDARPEPALVRACRDCPYYEACFPGLENPVIELYRLAAGRLEELVSAGVLGIEDLPAGVELNPLQ
ncbi:hypothetical protein JXD38_12625, partial [candidate division WOR-3 bacterium]|nr:hypothetical protein [candidate division WOR-3 bacterium]